MLRLVTPFAPMIISFTSAMLACAHANRLTNELTGASQVKSMGRHRTTVSSVQAGTAATIRGGTAGATITAGQPVYLDSAASNAVKPARANGATTAAAVGIASMALRPASLSITSRKTTTSPRRNLHRWDHPVCECRNRWQHRPIG